MRVFLLVLAVLVPVGALQLMFPSSGLWVAERIGLAHGLPSGSDLDQILSDCQIRDLPGADLVCPERLPMGAFSPVLRDMLVQSEDRRFRDHGGVDWAATAETLPRFLVGGVRALIHGGTPSQYGVRGASTLTQQVARLLVVGNDKTLFRKIREMIVAQRIEGLRSKEQIEAIYLNIAPLSGGSIGFDDAAHRVFGHSAAELDAAESALLVGELPAPAPRDARNPTKQQAADGAARRVLKKWLDGARVPLPRYAVALADLGKAEAHAEQPHLPDRLPEIRPYLDLARSQIDHAVPRDGTAMLVLHLDPRIQGWVDDAAESVAGPYVASGLFMRPSGEVVAVGASNYVTEQFDPAFRALRPIGSIGKILTLIGGHGSGVLASSFPFRTHDPDGYPHDHDSACLGLVTFQVALAKSCNKAFAHLAERIGPALPPLVRAFGFSPPEDIRQVATGGVQSNLLNVARMLAGLAHDGLLPEPRALAEVLDHSGAVLQPSQPSDLRRVTTPSVAQEVIRDLRFPLDPQLGGTGVRANSRLIHVWGKTGTSNDNRDAWFAGGLQGAHGTELVGGFWLGANDFRSMPGVSGGEGPAMAFRMVADQVARAETRRPVAGAPFMERLQAALWSIATKAWALLLVLVRAAVVLTILLGCIWLALWSRRKPLPTLHPQPLDGAAPL